MNDEASRRATARASAAGHLLAASTAIEDAQALHAELKTGAASTERDDDFAAAKAAVARLSRYFNSDSVEANESSAGGAREPNFSRGRR